jgi:hypothetical protein
MSKNSQTPITNMDEREDHLRRLEQAIEDAKELRSITKQNIADMDRLIREIKGRTRKKSKPKNSN